jgi:hypothetical protein
VANDYVVNGTTPKNWRRAEAQMSINDLNADLREIREGVAQVCREFRGRFSALKPMIAIATATDEEVQKCTSPCMSSPAL